MDIHVIKAINNKEYINFFDPRKRHAKKVTDGVFLNELCVRLAAVKTSSPFMPMTKTVKRLTNVRCVLYFYHNGNIDTLGLGYSDFMQLNSVFYIVDTPLVKCIQKILTNDGIEFREYMRFRTMTMSLFEWRTEDSISRLRNRNSELVYHTQEYVEGVITPIKKYENSLKGCKPIEIVIDIMGMPDYIEVHEKGNTYSISIGYKYGCYRRTECKGILWIRQSRKNETLSVEDIGSEKVRYENTQ